MTTFTWRYVRSRGRVTITVIHRQDSSYCHLKLCIHRATAPPHSGTVWGSRAGGVFHGASEPDPRPGHVTDALSGG